MILKEMLLSVLCVSFFVGKIDVYVTVALLF